MKTGIQARIISEHMSEIGRKGGNARAKRLTAARRQEIARNAGKAKGKPTSQAPQQQAIQP